MIKRLLYAFAAISIAIGVPGALAAREVPFEEKLGPVVERVTLNDGEEVLVRDFKLGTIYEFRETDGVKVYGIEPRYDIEPRQGVEIVNFIFGGILGKPLSVKSEKKEVVLEGKKVQLNNMIVTYNNGVAVYSTDSRSALKFITVVISVSSI